MELVAFACSVIFFAYQAFGLFVGDNYDHVSFAQGVKIPVNGGLIQQLNVVAGGDPTERSHSLAIQPPCVLVDGIIIIVV